MLVLRYFLLLLVGVWFGTNRRLRFGKPERRAAGGNASGVISFRSRSRFCAPFREIGNFAASQPTLVGEDSSRACLPTSPRPAVESSTFVLLVQPPWPYGLECSLARLLSPQGSHTRRRLPPGMPPTQRRKPLLMALLLIILIYSSLRHDTPTPTKPCGV